MRRLRLIDSIPPTDGKEITSALKVAFATQDRRRVDAHFGSAPTIVIYEVGPTSYRFVEAIEFDQVSGENGRHPDDGDDHVGAKVEAIAGCAILFSLAIGGMAAARVVNNRVYPLKVPSPEPIPDVIGRLQVMIRGAPPPWMRKLLHRETNLAFADE
jgi:nitrogen fixation protein NifX